MKSGFFMLSLGALFLACGSSAFANVQQMKAYKQAFPGESVKCAHCHAMAMPKKDSHDLNAYGQKAVGASKTPTADTYHHIGKD